MLAPTRHNTVWPMHLNITGFFKNFHPRHNYVERLQQQELMDRLEPKHRGLALVVQLDAARMKPRSSTSVGCKLKGFQAVLDLRNQSASYQLWQKQEGTRWCHLNGASWTTFSCTQILGRGTAPTQKKTQSPALQLSFSERWCKEILPLMLPQMLTFHHETGCS